ncbi:MAG: LysR substrate-binding domain-containing protein, partial [Pseudomonadota bacterium]
WIAAAEAMERAVAAASLRDRDAHRRVAGTVRLTAVPLLANRLLAPAVPDLLRKHPALEIELIAEPAALSLMGREADLALRLARPTGELRAKARRIGNLAYAVYGRDEGVPWIGYEDRLRDLPQTRWIREQTGRAPAFRVSDGETLLAAVLAGQGRSLLPERIAEAEGLRRLGRPAVLTREVWLMAHPDLADLPRIRAVSDWLTALIQLA